MTRLLLASGSPSRLRTLREAGIEPLVAVPNVDEDALEAAHPHADVRTLVSLLAEAKAAAVVDRLVADPSLVPDIDDVDGDVVLVACDSVLELGGAAVGKPHTAERTRALWQEMAGTSPVLWSAHWVGILTRTVKDDPHARGPWRVRARRAAAGETTVHLASPTAAELEAYIATSEPFEVAGALTIDGLGGAFVTGIAGDHHNVIGLSLPLLRTLLGEMNILWTDLWNRTPQ
ncbi:Maf family protein [Brevibacterium jeotgali]|uniref:Nucleoside triphosphate pyrophosphatase n=1 Tax=Brevibacterium jeotgali TaxID=1262550 RepID=A0A2H1L6I8_9MICO|nr:Maf family protein [Brevibacterium jeotgali]TWC03538.1 septum formation protein [Brevibacterium jeotgali]SMY12360.1 septum formation protein [Brevibacterium jeotgali]